jgi:16S rRNA processing protein RimM
MAKPERLIIGKIVGVFGVRGELKVQIESDFPERFKSLERVFICDAEYNVEHGRLYKGMALLKLKGVDDATRALELDDCWVEVTLADAVQLRPDQYFLYQIEGLQVETLDGEVLGTVSEILQTGANDVYVVGTPNGKELLLPALKQVIKQIDLEGGRMIVELMEGLRE